MCFLRLRRRVARCSSAGTCQRAEWLSPHRVLHDSSEPCTGEHPAESRGDGPV